ncbi:MAG TPA: SDR family NAD(P)-dependent oxidoreductase [Bacteroidaceae bacterium]|nr:SDR family NAD(P)-dependent oxidoreductase [Bacteroidaceae bacterium]
MISGGTRGIGAALVRAFLESGWNVAWSGTSQATVEKSLNSLRDRYPAEKQAVFLCDVTSRTDLAGLWDSAVKAFGLLREGDFGSRARATRYSLISSGSICSGNFSK